MDSSWHAPSVAYAASAGYGKTEILCARILALLLICPQNIHRILAVTFTRAAAGEMLERIFVMLAKALTCEKELNLFRNKMAQLNCNDCFRQLSRADLTALLQMLSRRPDWLAVSTIDSFMTSVAGVFALELGFPGKPEMVPPSESEILNRELLREILSEPSEEITQLCRYSMIGCTRRDFAGQCQKMLEGVEEIFDLYPERKMWGNFPPSLRDENDTSGPDLTEALKYCDACPPAEPELYFQKLRPLLCHCAHIKSAKENFSRAELETLNAFFEVWDTFPQDKPDNFKKNWDFAGCSDAVKQLLGHARKILFTQIGVRTRAAYDLIAIRRERYRRKIWEHGRMQFGDLPKLLSILREDRSAEIQYRLNLEFRHFLFDEFQDTSRCQWSVFAPFLPECNDADHSVFLVGDVKQAIYGWRGGNFELMSEVSQDKLRLDLPCSYRYGNAICGALNQLFGGEVLKNCPLIPETARTRFAENFKPHMYRTDEPDRPGCFQILNIMTKTDSGERDFAQDSAAWIARRLKELDYREKRLNCAILVRANESGAEVRDALIQRGFRAEDFSMEGEKKILNDRVCSGLAALVYYLEHPGDTRSAEWLRMDPSLKFLLPETAKAFQEMHSELAAEGLTAFLCRKTGELAARSRNTPGQAVLELIAAAREYESLGRNNPAGFRDFLEDRKFSGAAQKEKIRILTIHHSKGLTFDVVFLPLFQEKNGSYTLQDLSGNVCGQDWVLHNAGAVGMTDKAIREACEQRHAGKSFENLCTLYVALTRAKYEVCVLMPDLTKNQKHDYHSDVSDRKRGVQVRRLFCDSQKSYCNKDLLFDTFLQDKNLFPLERPLPLQNVSEVPFLIRTIGNPAWTETLKTEPPPVPPSLFEIPPPENPLPPRTVRIVPNQAGRNAGEFRFPSRSGAQDSGTGFGLEVHAFFETVENLASFVPPENLPLPVKRHYDACMKNPEVLKLLSGTDELWRERRFDVILHQDGVRKFVSGCFDRVQIRRDAGGKPVQAEIVDFKSNDVTEETLADAAEHYRGQMTVYRSALSKLLDLPEDRIGCTLLFTKLGRLCRM